MSTSKKNLKLNKMCSTCDNYICKAYHGTCRKYRISCFLKALPQSIYNTYKYMKTIPFWRWF